VKFLLTILTLTLFLFGNANQQSSVTSKLFLWKATKGSGTIYLFGTIHLPHPLVFSVMPKVKKVIDKSDTVYTEITLDMATQLSALKYMLLDNNSSLEKILPQKLYKECDDYLKSINSLYTIKSFNRYKVWALDSTLQLIKYQAKYKGIKPLDMQIFTYAKKQGKKVSGIESIKEQISVFDDLSQERQIAILKEDLRDLKETNLYKRMLKAYIEANGKEILKISKEQIAKSSLPKEFKDELLNKLLYSRNIRMAERIDALVGKHPEKKYLFAFGAMHFLGEKSVLYYLESRGYRISKGF